MGLGVLIQGTILLKENTPKGVVDQLLEDIRSITIDYQVGRYPDFKTWASKSPLTHISFIEDSKTIRLLILNVTGDTWDTDFEVLLSGYKQYIKKEGSSGHGDTNIDFYSLAEPGAFIDYNTIPDPEPKGDEDDD